ncbi:peroxisomal sarcosine oxidase-like [Oratosquilla oratoria]|uniref:peroxisomal sarcosine oxidase-like n=1 Tax=Oratosquilla oratoria TaxID=337810 RepID=UPI003F76E027
MGRHTGTSTRENGSNSLEKEDVFDVVMLGAGVHGCCAAYWLAKAGKRTLLIEQFPIPHSRGSSGGQSRIIRTANYMGSELTPLMKRTYFMWKEIEAEIGEELVVNAPLCMVSAPTSKFDIDKIHTSIAAGGNTPEALDIDVVNDRYRTSFPKHFTAVVDPGAGVLRADKCLLALQKLFLKNGGTFWDGWPVTQIEPGPCVLISGPKGTVQTRGVAICAGPWAGRLLRPLDIHIPLRTEKVGVYYWRVGRKSKDLTQYPRYIFIDKSSIENQFYALPALEYPGLVKLCIHHGVDADPDERDLCDMTPVLEKCKKYVENFFWDLYPEPVIKEACMYTTTPDNNFVLDRHPIHSNIVFACGFSGTGFKLGPVCGKAVSDLLHGKTPEQDFSKFAYNRFVTTSKL